MESIEKEYDPEAIHQARVATRKLRALLWLIADFLSKQQALAIAEDISGLGKALGALRDLDVLEEKLILLAEEAKVSPDPLVCALQEPRASARQNLEEGLSLHKEKLLRISGFFDDLPKLDAPLIQCLAQEKIGSLLADVVKRAEKKSKTIRQRHRLRIKIKRLRYACEVLFSKEGKRARRFLENLTDLQDTLGKMNDLAFAEKLLRDLAGNRQDLAAILPRITEVIYKKEKKLLPLLHKQEKIFLREAKGLPWQKGEEGYGHGAAAMAAEQSDSR